jgi:hypothetical protein
MLYLQLKLMMSVAGGIGWDVTLGWLREKNVKQ